VWVSGTGVRRIEFGTLPSDAHVDEPEEWPPLLRRTMDQLGEYFRGERTGFDLPLDLPPVSDFQRDVYRELARVPHGRVVTYGTLAASIGRPDLARAVGQAMGANPVPIVIPCHRVVAAGGRLHGFGGGLPAKVALLRLERVEVDGDRPSSRVRPEVLRLGL